MIRLFYNVVWPIGLLFFLPAYLVKMVRRGGYREKFGQRLGFYGDDVRDRLRDSTSTWFHAVSVGEVRIALKLAEELRKTEPDLRCALTITTTTGFALASKSAPRWIEVMYSPLDFFPVMHRAFGAIRPRRIVLVEAEIWPNMLAIAKARGVPVALVNARLSPRSENRFRKFRALVSPTFRLLDLVCVQEEADVEKWSALGVSRERIRCVGSIKFDPDVKTVDATHARNVLARTGITSERPIFLGGSTHAGEEKILAEAFRDVRETFPDLFLIIAPRHAERARAVRAICEATGLRVLLQSETAKTVDATPDCLIIDSTGELQQWYATATIVFVGKSLRPGGGQNPVEPLVAGKAVIFGPHMENFSALADALVKQNGAIQISTAGELAPKIVDLLRDPQLREQLVENARKVLQPHRGATAKTAVLIAGLQPAKA